MTDRLYTLKEYVDLMSLEVRAFYLARRLAARQYPAGEKSRTLDEWDLLFDDFAAERRSESAIDQSHE